MSYRRLRGLVVIGLLACVAIPGADSRALQDKPDAKTKGEHKSEIEQLEGDLKSTRDSIAGLRMDIDDLRKKILGSGSGTNTPLKVRGGAMTFRSGGKFGSDSAYPNGYCVKLNFSYFELGDVDDVLRSKHVPAVSYPNAAYPTVSTSWQIDLYDRDPTGTSETPRDSGIRIIATSNCVIGPAGTPPVAGVTITPESEYSKFYDNNSDKNLPDDDKTTYKKRFLDMYCQADHTMPSANGDEDSCEHISSIYINNSPKNKKADVQANPIGSYVCTNGECVIGVGLPPP
jgi:hypothetical protein